MVLKKKNWRGGKGNEKGIISTKTSEVPDLGKTGQASRKLDYENNNTTATRRGWTHLKGKKGFFGIRSSKKKV